jgi:hypothetical protein
LALFLAACEPSASPDRDEGESAKPTAPSMHVALTGGQINRLAIKTAAIAAAEYTPQVQGFGVVMRFDELAQLDSEIQTAEAAARQSASALARAKKLNNSQFMAGAALDAAVKQAATDEALLALARRKESVAFGRGAPWRTPSERHKILTSLSKGETSLVRVTFSGDELAGQVPTVVSVRRMAAPAAQTAVKAGTVWEAPADTSVPGRSFFALTPGGTLAEGERLLAFAEPGLKLSGVTIPAAALVMRDGKTWCYVAEAKGAFARRPLDTSRPLPDGYFARDGFAAGEAVVTQGQGLLLAFEINPEGGEVDED